MKKYNEEMYNKILELDQPRYFHKQLTGNIKSYNSINLSNSMTSATGAASIRLGTKLTDSCS